MSKGKFTKGKWNLHVREMTDTNGDTFRKCFIENGGTALAQFANFVDEDEANARLIAAAPEMYYILDIIDTYHAIKGVNNRWERTISKLLKKVRGEE